MENRKIIKNIIIGLISLSFLVSIGLNIFQHQQIRKLSKGVNGGMPTENQSASDVISSEVMQEGASGGKTFTSKTKDPNQDQAYDLEYQLDAAEEELDIALKQISDEAARKAELEKKESELEKYLRDESQLEKSMRDNLIVRQYSDLFEELNLSPEKQEKLIDILFDNMTIYSDLYTEASNTTPSEEKRAEFAKREKALKEEAEEAQEKIKDLLGNTDYEKYQEYRETMGARSVVGNFVDSLDESEKPTEQQQQRLITAMSEQLKEIYSEMSNEVSNEDTEFVFPSERDYEKDMIRSLEYRDRQNESYLRAAENILSASQIEHLKTYLQKERDQFKLSLEIMVLRNAE